MLYASCELMSPHSRIGAAEADDATGTAMATAKRVIRATRSMAANLGDHGRAGERQSRRSQLPPLALAQLSGDLLVPRGALARRGALVGHPRQLALELA